MKKLLVVVLAAMFVSGCAGKAALSQPPSTEEIQAAQNANSPLAVSAIHGERNSANGINISITFKNIDAKRTIKYANFNVQLINAVNDPVADEISGENQVSLQYTGPLAPGKINWGGLGGWPTAFYHPNAESLVITDISVEFMNGEKLSVGGVKSIPGTAGIISQKLY
ncbi:hypothetical protein [Alcanivorax sp.]|uniref:hypothetical protein n=1 Tax=Alcanivorax sp. TaxID=1872427 RepID=UPI0032D92973